ncbi:MAG: Mu-like prophage FluMu protein gp41 [Firmicutes bacterium]|nr:Mu-like prophage FluMu protein gp41 [Bacillota bacterium]
MEKLVLKKPLEYEGKKYEELQYDLDKLTGDDLLTAEATVNNAGMLAPVIDLSKAYQAAVFARAAKIEFPMMRKLSAKDFTEATATVMAFFGE